MAGTHHDAAAEDTAPRSEPTLVGYAIAALIAKALQEVVMKGQQAAAGWFDEF